MWWADLRPFRPREQTGRRPAVIWQSNALTRALQSVLVIPLTTNLNRANLVETAIVYASPEAGLPEDSVALAFQMRAVPAPPDGWHFLGTARSTRQTAGTSWGWHFLGTAAIYHAFP